MINFEKITKSNLETAIKIQNSIFPKENGALNLKFSVDQDFMVKFYGGKYRETLDFWLCKNENEDIVGITGIYSYCGYLPDDAWLGWYGVLPEHRKRGYGEEILLLTMEKAKEMGFKNFRLYTDLIDNRDAVNLYRKIGMIEEPYLVEDMGNEKILIFSKSLCSNEIEKLGDKNLFLKKQEEVQKASDQLNLKL